MQRIDPAIDPAIAPGARGFLNMLNSGGQPLESLSPEGARQVLVESQAAVTVDMTGIDLSEKTIATDGYTISLNIVRPAGNDARLPVFMFIHGGGWVLGDFPTHKRMVRDLVVLSGCAAVFVNYTRTPDAVYPQAVEEVYAATKWVAEHGAEINVDGDNLAIVGNSAGGNLATVTTMLAKERGGPELKLQILFWPVADAGFDTESYSQYAEQRFLTRSVMQWMFNLYQPDLEGRRDSHVAPLQATLDELRGLPPTLIQTAENDVLRDEGEAYGRRLAEAGVEVTTVRYNGMIHDFGLLNALARLPETRSMFVQAAAELRRYLVNDELRIMSPTLIEATRELSGSFV